MNRRNLLKNILRAAITGVALTATQSTAAAALGLNKYAEMVRLQKDAITTHKHLIRIEEGTGPLWSRTIRAPHYNFVMSDKIDHLLGFAMDNFQGDTKSKEAQEETSKIFNDRGYCDTLDENSLRQIMEVVVPIAIARRLLAVERIQFNPSGMKNWDRFSDNYQDLILGA